MSFGRQNVVQQKSNNANSLYAPTFFVTGRHKRAIEDHFDSNPELEAALRSKGRLEQADMNWSDRNPNAKWRKV